MYSQRKIPRLLDGTYFKIVSVESNGKVSAQCVPCGQAKTGKVLSGNIAATSNFLVHLKRAHEQLYKEYEQSSKDPQFQAKRQKQEILPFPVTIVSHAVKSSHRLVMQFVVNTMSPLSVVENPHFRTMIQGFCKDAEIQCVDTLRAQIAFEFDEMKKAITTALSKVKHVAATSDIWSSGSRSFLGVTAHWLTEDYQRVSVVLALKRFPGTHSYDRILGLIKTIFEEYGISDKVVSVTTDNGSNFVKAMEHYGYQPDYSNPVVDAAWISCDKESQEDVSLIEISTVADLVPEHIRCGSHTLSLVATTDLDKDIEKRRSSSRTVTEDDATCLNPYSNPLFKKVLRSTFAKCCALWNKVNRSKKAAAAIKLVIGNELVRPCPTRWNSTFDAISFLLKYKSQLNEIFDAAGMDALEESEVDFLESYNNAMSSLAGALDTLQGEKEFYFGYYVPVILLLKTQLDDLISLNPGRGYTAALAWALLEGVKTRFADIVNFRLPTIKTAVLAACSLPRFKLKWIPSEHRESVKAMFVEELKTFMEQENGNIQKTDDNEVESTSKWDKLFKEEEEEKSYPAEVKALHFLNNQSKDLSLLDSHSAVKSMFLRYNTPLPSSAPAERLFSYGGMILRPKRSKLTDEMFEMLVLLKLNQHVYKI